MLGHVLVAVAGVLAASAGEVRAPGLFARVPVSRSVEAVSGAVVRSRPVHVRLGRIPGAAPRDAARGVLPPPGHRLVLNLFDDVVVRARLTRSERHEGVLVWSGRIEGQPIGDVVLALVDGVLNGSVVWPGGTYRVRFDGVTHVVEQVDPGRFPEGACFEEVPGGPARAGAAPAVNVDDGAEIDVLVVYTPAARAAAGGTTAMRSQVALAVAETNAGYANSGVAQRLRLAAAVEVDYAESGTTADDMRTDLQRLTATADGFLDQVHALRDAHRADLVSLLVTGYDNPWGACGLAWLMKGNDPANAPWAFSVVDRDCATGYFSFGHELGHNMGLNHARQDYDVLPAGAYPYSFGYKHPVHAFRTVMAYDCPVSCPRVLHFSNPNVSYDGSPTGVPVGSPASAHNALSLDNTRVTVANWRARPTITLIAPNGGESWPAGSTQDIAWTSTDLPAGATVDIAYSDGTGRFFTTNGTAGGLVASVPASEGSYSWTVPFDAGASWRVRLCVPRAAPPAHGSSGGRDSSCLASDTSDSSFSIVP